MVLSSERVGHWLSCEEQELIRESNASLQLGLEPGGVLWPFMWGSLLTEAVPYPAATHLAPKAGVPPHTSLVLNFHRTKVVQEFQIQQEGRF